MSRRVVALFPRVDRLVLEHGRAHMLRLRQADADKGMVLFNLHLEPASIVDANRWPASFHFMLGDLSFVHTDDHSHRHRTESDCPGPKRSAVGSRRQGGGGAAAGFHPGARTTSTKRIRQCRCFPRPIFGARLLFSLTSRTCSRHSSMGRRWMLEALARLCLPRGMPRLMAQLYADCEPLLLFAGEVVRTLRVTSGIKQGCPVGGSIFALSVDPFLRCFLVWPRAPHGVRGRFGDGVRQCLAGSPAHCG